jgi:hypothetical protein
MKRDDKSFVGIKRAKYECVGNWVMKPPLRPIDLNVHEIPVKCPLKPA